jgi:hypothetical protein
MFGHNLLTGSSSRALLGPVDGFRRHLLTVDANPMFMGYFHNPAPKTTHPSRLAGNSTRPTSNSWPVRVTTVGVSMAGMRRPVANCLVARAVRVVVGPRW